jgi:hypothetical protein
MARSGADGVYAIMQPLRRIFKAIQDYSHEVSKTYGVTALGY